MKEQTIGVEIEMNNITRNKAAKIAAEFFGTDDFKDTASRNGYQTWSAWDAQGREWKFQKDVSIAGPDSEKCELVTPILNYSDIETLQELVRRLRKAGAISHAGVGAGVHIHIGAKGHTPQSLRNLANLMASHEMLIADALRIDQGRMNRYCRTVNPNFIEQLNKKKPTTMAQLADIWYTANDANYGRNQHYNESRYHVALSAPTSKPVTNTPNDRNKADSEPTATTEYSTAFWDMIRNKGDQFAVRNALSVGEDTEGGFTVPSEFERRLVQSLEENNIFRQMATVIKTNSGTRKIPIATDTMEAQWIDEGEEIPETDTRFGQTTLSAYKLGTMIKISNELLHDSAFDLASYIATRFGVAMGNAEERAFFTGDGDKKPLGILADTGGAEIGVTSASQTAITFDEIFDLYYSLKSPYRRNAQFVCNETILLQLMKLKDKNEQYLWKPSLDIAKPDTLLGRPIRTSSFMPGISKGEKVLLFGDMKNYWVADRQNRTFRRLNELYARTDQVGFMTTQRVDGRLILPESVKVLKMAGNKATTGGTTTG